MFQPLSWAPLLGLCPREHMTTAQSVGHWPLMLWIPGVGDVVSLQLEKLAIQRVCE